MQTIRYFIAVFLVLGLFAGTTPALQNPPGAIPAKLVKVRDDLYMIENVNQTVGILEPTAATSPFTSRMKASSLWIPKTSELTTTL